MNMQVFFDKVRFSIFGGKLRQGQVNGCETILASCSHLSLPQQAYLLATAYHETAQTMLPVRETLAKSDDEAIRRLNNAWSKDRLPWVREPYWRKDPAGKAWYGRGYVQLTHRNNYAVMGRRVGVDLLDNPDAAMNPEVAAKILVTGCEEGLFRRPKLSDYINEDQCDFVSAREVINGDVRKNGELIASYAEHFLNALEAARARTGDDIRPKKPGLLERLKGMFG